ncbi:hypothetical protein PoB_001288900 [Plakobranchus ocellatus]|uniref:Uncharacterized protein n=1 Tax=Plakobranchus ocellatus TaxID=259542 RepID=A0AAV3YTI3_9GAST|nr:hypothetical protein PoB_001288900 [Plakobranchus ocellatus]
MRRFFKFILLVTCLTAVVTFMWILNLNQLLFTHNFGAELVKRVDIQLFSERNPSTTSCPDILSGMTRGRWKTRDLTTLEQDTIDSYLHEERGAYMIPHTYQRRDGLCGNVTYDGAPLYNHMWFKAICDPKGATPCCQLNKCIPASVEDCQCPSCFDERQAVHAEYAKWVPEDARCAVPEFSAEDACDILQGATIEFVGDSFIRHMFAATVILLSGGKEYSSLTSNLPSHILQICRGFHQFTAIQCRQYLNETQTLCNDTVQMRYTQIFPSSEFLYLPSILKRVHKSSKALLVVGLGIHDDFNFDIVQKRFLLPFLNLRQHVFTHAKGLGQDNLILDLGKVVTNFSTLSNASLEYLMPRKRGQKLYNENVLPTLEKEKLLNLTSFWEILRRRPKDVYDMERQKRLAKGGNVNLTLVTTRNPRIPYMKDNSVIFQRFPRPDLDSQKLLPKVVWVGTHAPGLLKAPKFVRQTAQGVSNFNHEVQTLLRDWKIPYLDTFSFSSGAVSFDGTHYGWGVNMLKANMLINYIREGLVKSKLWS